MRKAYAIIKIDPAAPDQFAYQIGCVEFDEHDAPRYRATFNTGEIAAAGDPIRACAYSDNIDELHALTVQRTGPVLFAAIDVYA